MENGRKRYLLLGLGNTILKDDGVGVYAVRAIRDGRACNGWEIEESALSGGKLLDVILDYQNVLVVDSILMDGKEPGEILRFNMEEIETTFGPSPHYMGLPQALRMARQMKLPIPERIRVVAINIRDPYTFHEGLSPEIEEAFPRLVSEIEQEMLSMNEAPLSSHDRH